MPRSVGLGRVLLGAAHLLRCHVGFGGMPCALCGRRMAGPPPPSPPQSSPHSRACGLVTPSDGNKPKSLQGPSRVAVLVQARRLCDSNTIGGVSIPKQLHHWPPQVPMPHPPPPAGATGHTPAPDTAGHPSKRTQLRRNATYYQYPIQRCADQHGAYYRRSAANAFLGAYSHRSAATACIVV